MKKRYLILVIMTIGTLFVMALATVNIETFSLCYASMVFGAFESLVICWNADKSYDEKQKKKIENAYALGYIKGTKDR